MEMLNPYRCVGQGMTHRGDKVWVECPVWEACQVPEVEEDSLI